MHTPGHTEQEQENMVVHKRSYEETNIFFPLSKRQALVHLTMLLIF
jgi:hypothetical protein